MLGVIAVRSLPANYAKPGCGRAGKRRATVALSQNWQRVVIESSPLNPQLNPSVPEFSEQVFTHPGMIEDCIQKMLCKAAVIFGWQSRAESVQVQSSC